MDKVILKANELYEVLVERLRSIAEEKSNLNKKLETLLADQKKADTMLADLTIREKAVSKIEDIINAEKSAKQAKKEAELALEILAKDKNSFAAETAKGKAEMQTLLQEARKQKELSDKSWRELREAEKKLAEEKASYKAKVIEEIQKRVG